MSRVLKHTCYLVLAPQYSRYNKRLEGFKVERVMQREPKTKNAHVIALDLEVPAEVFEPAKITAKVKVEKEEIQVAVKPKRMPQRKNATWGE